MSLELKRPIKVRSLKPFSLFVFFFALVCERIFIKTHSTDHELKVAWLKDRKIHCFTWTFVHVALLLLLSVLISRTLGRSPGSLVSADAVHAAP